MTGHKGRLQFRCQLQVGVTQPIHPHHMREVVSVGVAQAEDCRQAHQEHDGQQQSEEAKAGPEGGRLRDQNRATTAGESTVQVFQALRP
jgi:hypothetical protein